MKNTPGNLRANPLWKEVFKLSEYFYSILDEITDNNPEEQWTTVSKLRSAANDCLFYTAQAIANPTIDAAEYDWSGARKNLFALQSLYLFAGKQKFLKLDPEIVVTIDNLIAEIDSNLEESKKAFEHKSKAELDPWKEKYRIWKEMQND